MCTASNISQKEGTYYGTHTQVSTRRQEEQPRAPVPVAVQDDVLAPVAVPKGKVLKGDSLAVGQALQGGGLSRLVNTDAMT